MLHPGFRHGIDKIRLGEWIHLNPELIWAYEADVALAHRTLTVHDPGQSAYLLKRGQVQIRTAKGRVAAREGDWVFPKQGERFHKFSDDARILSVHFVLNWPGGQPLFDWDVALVLPGAASPRMETRARGLAQLIRREFPRQTVDLLKEESSLNTHLEIRHQFDGWLCSYVRALTDAGLKPSRLGPIDRRVLQTVQHLDAAPLGEPFDEKGLARRLKLSPSQLDRLFGKEFGTTPRRYFDRRRLEQAMAMLQNGATVKETAFDLGFGSLSHFSVWFHQRKGVSPRAFQREGP